MRHRPYIIFIPKYALPLIIFITIIIIGGSYKIINTYTPAFETKVIVIDPGHGGNDPGAQYAGIKEKDINLAVALRLKELLETKGLKVFLTRDTDKDFYPPGLVKGRTAKRIELNQRIKVATTNNADLFVSIHTNSFPKNSSHGPETYYHIKSAAGKTLAEYIQQQLISIQPNKNRVAKAGDYYVLNQTKMPAVIVEIGFISNTNERKLLLSNDYKDSLARSISTGIENFLKDFPAGVNTSPTLSKLEGPAISTDGNYTLYFPSSDYETLIAEKHKSDAAVWEKLATSTKITYVLNELFKGPTDPKENSSIPAETKLINVTLENGIATINLSRDIRDHFPGGTSEEDMTLKSIIWSTLQFPGVNGIKLLIDGQTADSIGGHIILDHIITAASLI